MNELELIDDIFNSITQNTDLVWYYNEYSHIFNDIVINGVCNMLKEYLIEIGKELEED